MSFFATSTDGGEADGGGSGWRSSLGAMAQRAREMSTPMPEFTAPLVPNGGDEDVESGEGNPRWANWAQKAQQGLNQGLEKAKSVDWAEKAKGVQANARVGFERVSETATVAGSSIREKASAGVERAKSVEWSDQAQNARQGMARSLSNVSTSASSAASSVQERLNETELGQKARDSAAVAAGAAKGAASTARSSISSAGERVQGAAALAMDPKRIATFLAVFGVGFLLIVLSINFLPILLLAPMKFATFFTLGSVTMMSSFAVLKGPMPFLAHLVERPKLPFSCAYGAGLFGTLWATIFLRSYVLTAVFALLQAVALLYFVCSYMPGGTAGLSMIGRLGGRSARSLILG